VRPAANVGLGQGTAALEVDLVQICNKLLPPVVTQFRPEPEEVGLAVGLKVRRRSDKLLMPFYP